MEQQEVIEQENHTEESVKEVPEFTNLDAENLLTSCLDIQKLDIWGLQQEIQLAKLIKKLQLWTAPLTESRDKFATGLGFVKNNTGYGAMSKYSLEEKEQKVQSLNQQISDSNKEEFEHWGELKAMLPLPLFNTKKLGDDIKFTGRTEKQYFIYYCIKND